MNHGKITVGNVSNSEQVVIGTNIYINHDGPEPLDAEATQQIEDRYRQQIVKYYNQLTLTGLPERESNLHKVTLDKVFVKLNTEIAQAGRLDNDAQRERMRLEQELYTLEQSGRGERNARAQELQARLFRLEQKARKPQTVTLSVADALHKYRHLVIVGGPGSGKTTLSRWLSLVFAQGEQDHPDALGPQFTQQRLPILLELRRFASYFEQEVKNPTTPDLATVIANFISQHAYYPDTPVEFVLNALYAGRCFVVLDGVDEIADLGARQELTDAISAFMHHPDGNYRENLVLVTSRPHGFRDVGLGSSFQRCKVKPFSKEDVAQFITHWYATAYGDNDPEFAEEAQTLIEAISDNSRVTELATNPLLCTIIAIVYRNNRVLPNRRVELYLKCCEALLDTWERNKNIKESGLIGNYDWQTKLELLAPLAYWLHSEHERVAAPEEAFVAQLAHTLTERGLTQASTATQESRRFIEVIRDRSGILQGRGDGSLEFAHRTFQEYLAARHIAVHKYPDYIDMVMPHLHDQWWSEVHLLVIGYLGAGRENSDKTERLLITMLAQSGHPLPFLKHIPMNWEKLDFSEFCYRRFQQLYLHNKKSFFKPIRIYLWQRPLYITHHIRIQYWLMRQSIGARLHKLQLQKRLSWSLQREFELVLLGYRSCGPLASLDRVHSLLQLHAEILLKEFLFDPGREDTTKILNLA
ncbi:MAG: NACHT domain-containing protein, partial [Chloroflexota bacterium]